MMFGAIRHYLLVQVDGGAKIEAGRNLGSSNSGARNGGFRDLRSNPVEVLFQRLSQNGLICPAL
jgi:hypothetical protein